MSNGPEVSLMKINTIVIVFLLCIFSVTGLHAEKYLKLAQTGFQFLSVDTDARGASMAGAMTTLDNSASSFFYNPATLSHSTTLSMQLQVNYNSWIAGISHNSASLTIAPSGGRYGIFGFSWQYTDYGEIQGAMPFDNNQGYILTEKFNPSALSLGIGYSKALSSKFGVGAQLKYVGQQLGNHLVQIGQVGDSVNTKLYKEFAVAFDFGTIYYTGWKSLAFGMSVRNFSNEIAYESESFQLPLTFSIGVSMDLIDFVPEFSKYHKLLISMDAVHPRSYPEYIKTGLEYGFNNLLFFRMGYVSNQSERGTTFGFGIKKMGLIFDYCYMPFGIFDQTQNFTLGFSL